MNITVRAYLDNQFFMLGHRTFPHYSIHHLDNFEIIDMVMDIMTDRLLECKDEAEDIADVYFCSYTLSECALWIRHNEHKRTYEDGYKSPFTYLRIVDTDTVEVLIDISKYSEDY